MQAWIEAFAARYKLSQEARADLEHYLASLTGAPTSLYHPPPLALHQTIFDEDMGPVSLDTLDPIAREPLQSLGPATHWSGTNRLRPRPAHTLTGQKLGAQGTDAHAPMSSQEPSDFFRRYEDLGLIGLGGMGEVRRVRDIALNRVVAVKIIRDDLQHQSAALVRFVEEAQVTAQLKHPGIIPVHELGHLPDGRIYFTMKEVKGHTLGKIIREVHDISQQQDSWQETEEGWSFRRLLETFHKVCEAIAYAHARGVLHRDLKPDNVMVGGFGEVLIVDWGVAKVLGRPDRLADDNQKAITTDRSQHNIHATQTGNLIGTLVYMSPEQARGEVEHLTPAADVYALGAILYEILAGRPPYTEDDPATLLHLVQTQSPYFPPPPEEFLPTATVPTMAAVAQWHHLWTPPKLLSICQRAMARQPEDRFADAGDLAQAIVAWLDGSQKREQARALVEQATRLLPQISRFQERAAEKRLQAEVMLEDIKPSEPEEAKIPAWELQRDAEQLELEAALREVEYLQKLQGALSHAADLEEAHHLLAQHYQAQHQAAEARRDTKEAAKYAVHLRNHDIGRRYASYLKGDGAFSLYTSPPGAQVDLYEYVEHHRRLEPRFVGDVGQTPIVERALPMGSYLLVLRAEGHIPVRYPISIDRQERWHGVVPGESQPRPVWLPPEGALGSEQIYVPAGWFWAGGDPVASEGFDRQRIWVNSFCIQRFPVTNEEYLAFLNDLLQQGREEDALRYVPCERASTEGEAGVMIYKRNAQGYFELGPDADGDIWEPQWPVLMIDWWSAYAYTQWLSERTGQPWRLPTELEWEKAARGVDGRFLPWGDHFDASWCCMRDSHTSSRLTPAPVDSYPIDESPYGARGFAGNCREWCYDVYTPEGHILNQLALQPSSQTIDVNPDTYRTFRGGSWLSNASNIRSTGRNNTLAYNRSSHLGFRVCRSIG